MSDRINLDNLSYNGDEVIIKDDRAKKLYGVLVVIAIAVIVIGLYLSNKGHKYYIAKLPQYIVQEVLRLTDICTKAKVVVRLLQINLVPR